MPMNLGQIRAKAQQVLSQTSDEEIKELAQALADLARYVDIHLDHD